MGLKGKPDLSKLKGVEQIRPAAVSVDEFIEGATSEATPRRSSRASTSPKQKKRRKKLVTLSEDVIMELKQAALNESARLGRRITDGDLVQRGIVEVLQRLKSGTAEPYTY